MSGHDDAFSSSLRDFPRAGGGAGAELVQAAQGYRPAAAQDMGTPIDRNGSLACGTFS